MTSSESWDADPGPSIDPDRLARLRRYMIGEGMAVRLRCCIEARRDAARLAAAEDLLAWCRRLETVGYPSDPPPETGSADATEAAVDVAAHMSPVVEELARRASWETGDESGDDMDVTLARVLALRRRGSPEGVVALRRGDYRAVAAGSMDASESTYLLPEPLYRRLARIDAAALGASSLALSWALRMSLIVKATQRLEQCHTILTTSGDETADADRARALAAIAPIASALVASERMRPEVAPHLLSLMLASIIDTWIGHELATDREESSDEGIDRVRMEQALAEREGTLRWLDRVIARLTAPPDDGAATGVD